MPTGSDSRGSKVLRGRAFGTISRSGMFSYGGWVMAVVRLLARSVGGRRHFEDHGSSVAAWGFACGC